MGGEHEVVTVEQPVTEADRHLQIKLDNVDGTQLHLRHCQPACDGDCKEECENEGCCQRSDVL
jgi:hypothetical protein